MLKKVFTVELTEKDLNTHDVIEMEVCIVNTDKANNSITVITQMNLWPLKAKDIQELKEKSSLLNNLYNFISEKFSSNG